MQEATMPSTFDIPSNSRVLIIGNSGAGKSWLATRLAMKLRAPHIDLDDLYFVGEGYRQTRTKAETIDRALTMASQACWVMEGIYGWLAEPLLATTTHLVWLTPSSEACVANIIARGPRGAPAESFIELLAWAGTYQSREGSSAFGFHQKLFSGFGGSKYQLRSRHEISQRLACW
jgi:energy-coupling factor transporter ATP-binding protein EcfA2